MQIATRNWLRRDYLQTRVQTEQLQPPKWINTWLQLGGNKDVSAFSEFVYSSRDKSL